MNTLLSKGNTNAKTIKNILETHILYLAPANQLEGFNLCPFASEGCKSSCLYTAGRGAFNNVQTARLNKTKMWAFDRSNFYIQLVNEIFKLSYIAVKQDKTIAIRLNGTSDIDHIELSKKYTGIDLLTLSNVIFYDYTKNHNHIKKYLNTSYKLTFSRSEINEEKVLDVLNMGGNVAVVFKDKLPEEWNGFRVINGDETDLRYFDPINVVVGLIAKGKAKKDTSGFVVNE